MRCVVRNALRPCSASKRRPRVARRPRGSCGSRAATLWTGQAGRAPGKPSDRRDVRHTQAARARRRRGCSRAARPVRSRPAAPLRFPGARENSGALEARRRSGAPFGRLAAQTASEPWSTYGSADSGIPETAFVSGGISHFDRHQSLALSVPLRACQPCYVRVLGCDLYGHAACLASLNKEAKKNSDSS